MSHKFWNAVDKDDVDTLGSLLAQSPSLVAATYFGEAWKPNHVWSHKQGKPVPTPTDFPFTNTALHTAVVNSRIELVQLLLRHGADANAVGFEQNKGLAPPVVLAAWEGSPETLRALLENGADPNFPASAESALYTAAEHGSIEKINLLLAHGARHDIFTAAIVGNAELVDEMLTAYPSLKKARSAKRGRTPKEEAEHHEQVEVLRLF